jgi:hypothetical protein
MNPLPMSPNGVTHVPGPHIKPGDDEWGRSDAYPFFFTSFTDENSMPSARSLV